jgi:hypothetical protein
LFGNTDESPLFADPGREEIAGRDDIGAGTEGAEGAGGGGAGGAGVGRGSDDDVTDVVGTVASSFSSSSSSGSADSPMPSAYRKTTRGASFRALTEEPM